MKPNSEAQSEKALRNLMLELLTSIGSYAEKIPDLKQEDRGTLYKEIKGLLNNYAKTLSDNP